MLSTGPLRNTIVTCFSPVEAESPTQHGSKLSLSKIILKQFVGCVTFHSVFVVMLMCIYIYDIPALYNARIIGFLEVYRHL
jgi:hypothetical protein